MSRWRGCSGRELVYLSRFDAPFCVLEILVGKWAAAQFTRGAPSGEAELEKPNNNYRKLYYRQLYFLVAGAGRRVSCIMNNHHS